MNRLTPLAKEKAVPQQDLDNALVAQQVAKANVDAGQANYDTTVLHQKVGVDQATAAVSAAEACAQECRAQSELLHGHGAYGRTDWSTTRFSRESGRTRRTDSCWPPFRPWILSESPSP